MRDRRARARGWSTTVSCTRDTVSAGAPWSSRYQQPDPRLRRHGPVHRQQRFGEQDIGAVGTPGAPSPVGGAFDPEPVVDLRVVPFAEKGGVLHVGIALVEDPFEDMTDVAPVAGRLAVQVTGLDRPAQGRRDDPSGA